MEEFLKDVAQELPQDRSSAAYATLAKVMGNILRNPTEPKFRTLRKDNRLVADNICSSLAAVSLLLLVGFEDHDSTFCCPEGTDLEQMRAVSEALQPLTMNLDLLMQPAEAMATAPASPSVAAPTAPAGALVSRSAPRLNEAEKQRSEQLDQLQALRADRRARHRENTAAGQAEQPVAVAAAPAVQLAATEEAPATLPAHAVDLLTGPQPVPDSEGIDLLSDCYGADHATPPPEVLRPTEDTQATAAQPQPGPCVQAASVEGVQRSGPRTVYDFQKRDGGQRQQQAAESLDDIRRLQREKFQQFQTDPQARSSELYDRPPSGVFDASSKPAAVAKQAGQDASSWLSDASERFSAGLSSTSKQLTEGLKGTSEQLSKGLSGVAEQLSGAWHNSPTQQPQALQPGPLPGRFRVVRQAGAMVRQGVELDTPVVDVLHFGSEFVGLELGTTHDGVPRLRFEAPLRGWLSLRQGIVERVAEEHADEFG